MRPTKHLPTFLPTLCHIRSPNHFLLPPAPTYTYTNIRTLSTTPPLSKKGGKQDSKRTLPLNASKPSSQTSAFDFSDYETAIRTAHERLKEELRGVKAGGLGVEAVEDVKVRLGAKGEEGGGKDRKGKGEGNGEGKGGGVKVGDLASIIVRGRNMCVLVGEKDHLKPLTTALSSLSPTPSPTDPLTLLIPIPPTTTESRLAAQALASKKGEEALFALREARGAQRKKHRAMELGRTIGPDELRRAEKEVERVNKSAVEEVRGIVEGCRRGLEGG